MGGGVKVAEKFEEDGLRPGRHGTVVPMATSVPAVPKKLNWKARAVCFTINNYTQEEVLKVRELGKNSKYLIFGYEEAPTTGTRHLQGYVAFQNPRSADAVKADLGGRPHLERAKGNAQQNKTYCSKDKNFEEFGELPKQGERTDWAQAVEQIQSGMDIADVVVEQPQLLPGIRSLERFKNLLLKPKHRDVHVVVLYGDAGTGKSRWAYEQYPDLYSKPRGDWWDGYTGQETILLDDYYGYLPYSELLRVLDRYPYNAAVKGGFVWAQWNTVIITSNKKPEEWYSHGLTPALRRRLNICFYMKNINGETCIEEDPSQTQERETQDY